MNIASIIQKNNTFFVSLIPSAKKIDPEARLAALKRFLSAA
jgi:hypothetical protein